MATAKKTKKTAKKAVKKAVKKTVKRASAKKKTTTKKKTTQKATTKAVKKVSRPKKGKKLPKKELSYFTSLLLEKRAELLGDVNSMETEALKKSRHEAAGDLSNMPIHMADIGTDNYEQEFTLDLLDGERKLLVKIDQALVRIKDGTYGICLGTGRNIKRIRLEACPWSEYCIEYARMVEKGLLSEGQQVNEPDEDILDKQTNGEDTYEAGDYNELNLDEEEKDPFGYYSEEQDEQEEDDEPIYFS